MVDNVLGGCLFESVLTIWCSSLLEDARAILLVYNYSWQIPFFLCNAVNY